MENSDNNIINQKNITPENKTIQENGDIIYLIIENNQIKVDEELLKKAEIWKSHSRKAINDYEVGYNIWNYLDYLKSGLVNSSNLRSHILGAIRYENEKDRKYSESEILRNKRYLNLMGENKKKFLDYFIEIDSLVLYANTINKEDAGKLDFILRNNLNLVNLGSDTLELYKNKLNYEGQDFLFLLEYNKKYDNDFINALNNGKEEDFNEKINTEALKYISDAQKIVILIIEGYEKLIASQTD